METTAPDARVFRVGYAPDPWAWVPWEYVERATGRWDDSENTYRTLYTGGTPEACFIEVLAQFRPDPLLVSEMAGIEPDPRDADYARVPAGAVDRSWLQARRLGSAGLTGSFVDVTHKDTIAELRRDFLTRAVHYGLSDLDASAIRAHEPRELTREISRFLYRATGAGGGQFDGISYESRFGAGLRLWAVFERPRDAGHDRSTLLTDVTAESISEDDRALAAALDLHGLELA